jgi:hypothetical protein
MIEQSIAAVNDLAMFEAQVLPNISWAYAMADIDAPWLFNDRTQLYHWQHVWQTKDKSNIGLPSLLKKQCINAYNRSQRVDKYYQLFTTHDFETPSPIRCFSRVVCD